jgi:DNA-binding NtrC family response regulator
MKRLLLCHPDQEVYSAVERTLTRVGVTIDAVANADDVLLHLGSNDHALVVVDRIVAGSRISEILERLRGRSTPKPIVIVTSTDETDLDPNIVSLIVPSSYDVSTLVGVILACAADAPMAIESDPNTTHAVC